MTRVIALLGIVGLVAGVSGCGGGGGKSLSTISSCLGKDHFATVAGAPADKATNFAGQVFVRLNGANAVGVTVLTTPKAAASFEGDQKAEFQAIGKGGTAPIKDKVVVSYPYPVPQSVLTKVKSCAF